MASRMQQQNILFMCPSGESVNEIEITLQSFKSKIMRTKKMNICTVSDLNISFSFGMWNQYIFFGHCCCCLMMDDILWLSLFSCVFSVWWFDVLFTSLFLSSSLSCSLSLITIFFRWCKSTSNKRTHEANRPRIERFIAAG